MSNFKAVIPIPNFLVKYYWAKFNSENNWLNIIQRLLINFSSTLDELMCTSKQRSQGALCRAVDGVRMTCMPLDDIQTMWMLPDDIQATSRQHTLSLVNSHKISHFCCLQSSACHPWWDFMRLQSPKIFLVK